MVDDFQRTLSLRLLVWALLSVLAGGLLWLTALPFEQGFGVQNAAWGAVDGLIALFGLRGLNKKLAAVPNLSQSAKRARWLRRILWVNTALDVLYVSGGLLLALSVWRAEPFNAGMGWGIVLQGGFLLVFDSLHAWRTPQEMTLPQWGLLDGSQHDSFELCGGQPAALFIHGFPDTPFAMRPLAETLHAEGWTVAGLLLAGFGPEISHLYQQRVNVWTEQVCAEIKRLQQDHNPVLLVGFSLGGGLCIPAAVCAHPDGLALLAPFAMPKPGLLTPLYLLARIFLPSSLAVGRFLDLNAPDIRQGFAQLTPDLLPDDPRIQAELRGLRAPLVFLEQFLHLSHLVHTGAPHWQGPTLLLQGQGDSIVRPSWVRQLAARLGSRPPVHVVPGGHNINLPGRPSFDQVATALTTFARTLQ